MAVFKLGAKAVGSIVKLKVSGVAKEFIVVHQGRPSDIYDTSCDGTWLLMKDIYENHQWHSSDANDYVNSTIHSYLNSTFLNLFEANIKNVIKQVKIPYCPGNGTSGTVNSGANGLSAKIFLLSGCEVGFKGASQYSPIDGAQLSYFEGGTSTSALNKRIAYLNGSARNWWLRSQHTNYAGQAWLVLRGGGYNNDYCSSSFGVRPALVLPSSLLASDDGSISTNTAPTTPSSISVPASIQGGTSITVSWGASTDAEGNLEGYAAERSVDGGSTWAQIYQGSGRSTETTVPFGTESVMYRVRAYDSEGLFSGYRTNAQVTVVNNTAPGVPAGITVPETVPGGSSLTVTWGSAGDAEDNLSGYSLERSVDGGDWEEVYKGAEQTYTDAVTKGWTSVAYRVRAYDSEGAFGGYAVSPVRAVDNNTVPVITCSAGELGTKTTGFSVEYAAGDADGDPVTVTEAVDGTALRTFTAVPEAANTLEVDGEFFMKLPNGEHTAAITADDGKACTVHTLTFTKLVTAASVTLREPMPADGPVTVCALSVSGSIPEDAEFGVEVTNNALDDEPAWEDCTAEVGGRANHIFQNQAAAKGFAFSFRIRAARGPSGAGGYITSVQGGFQ